MKSQANIEFIIDVAIFSTVIIVVVATMVSESPVLYLRYLENERSSDAFKISEILIFDTGYPSNWNQNNVNRFGFSDGRRHFLSEDKIKEFFDYCKNDYKSVRDKFDINGDLIVEVYNSKNEMLGKCGTLHKKVAVSKIVRFGVLFNTTEGKYEIIKIVVGVY